SMGCAPPPRSQPSWAGRHLPLPTRARSPSRTLRPPARRQRCPVDACSPPPPARVVTTGPAPRGTTRASRTDGADPPPFEAEFARAWDTPGHTRYQLPDTDVNAVLAARYTTSGPLALTRGMLWDMEVRKAAHPGTYIPSVVHAGSDRSWNRHR